MEKWEQIAGALSKTALLAMLGLALIVIALETAFIAYLAYSVRTAAHVPKITHRRLCGVFWDDDASSLCPVCETLLHIFL